MDFHADLVSLFVATLFICVMTLQLQLCVLRLCRSFIATFLLDIPFGLLSQHNILMSRQNFSRCLNSSLHDCCNKVGIVVTMFLAFSLNYVTTHLGNVVT